MPRSLQSTAGLATATLVAGVTLGGLVGVVSALGLGRFGRLGVRGVPVLVAGLGFVATYLVPFLAYPPNPPAVGQAATIGYRTALYFILVAISLIVGVCAVVVARRLTPRWGAWWATLACSAGYAVVLGVTIAIMPGYDEVPADFPAAVLYDFRRASLLTQLTLWGVVGLTTAELAHRLSVHGRRGAAADSAGRHVIAPPSAAACASARERLAALAKPLGALGRLEDAAAWVAACQGVCPPRALDRVRLTVLAGDHGVSHSRVSAYPREVTGAMVAAMVQGGAAANVLARQHGVSLQVLDIGVDADLGGLPREVRRHRQRASSGSIDREDALSLHEVRAALATGAEVAAEEVAAGADLLVLGDLGIGNTTPAAALVAATFGVGADEVTGRGTGVDDAALAHKTGVVAAALARTGARAADPYARLAALGSADLAATFRAGLNKRLQATLLNPQQASKEIQGLDSLLHRFDYRLNPYVFLPLNAFHCGISGKCTASIPGESGTVSVSGNGRRPWVPWRPWAAWPFCISIILTGAFRRSWKNNSISPRRAWDIPSSRKRKG